MKKKSAVKKIVPASAAHAHPRSECERLDAMEIRLARVINITNERLSRLERLVLRALYNDGKTSSRWDRGRFYASCAGCSQEASVAAPEGRAGFTSEENRRKAKAKIKHNPKCWVGEWRALRAELEGAQ